ncbi:hypothetical protein ND748_07670 [Frankia sp. AiPs1]|uniref:hypothetical protein n=1 Tax=Frankia sp. AiPs1 TaxID=573493 RepID=UPI002042FD5F|nr:hypothetical protein [Frankia sp. AiPs1]MCM3921544.1 hypothetical protein [Frankia sp. AiPs1]
MENPGGSWWLDAVRPEWGGHTWRSLEAAGPPALVAEARSWTDDPPGDVLYIHAAQLRAAYAFAVAVADRATTALLAGETADFSPLAVGLLDELSVPGDPDPDRTREVRHEFGSWGATDTHDTYLGRYAEHLGSAPLALLRLPAAGSRDVDHVLDRVADRRNSHLLPTLIAGSTPPDQITPAFGARIAWRLGFAEADGRPIGRTEASAAVLNLDHPPA